MDSPALELLNSRLAQETGKDPLDDGVWLEELCRRWQIPLPGAPSEPELRSLRKLRAVLVGIAASVSEGQTLGAGDLLSLNRILSRTISRSQLFVTPEGRYGLEVTPIKRDWNAVLAELAGHFARLLLISQPPRLKLCPHCGRAFFDETRTRRRIWCDPKRCGNSARVRRFRERRREGAPSD